MSDMDATKMLNELLRKYPTIRKPQDAIHAATAALNDVDELHTFDGNDLIGLDGQIPMANGQRLKICKPPSPPPPVKAAELPLFDLLAGMDAETIREVGFLDGIILTDAELEELQVDLLAAGVSI